MGEEGLKKINGSVRDGVRTFYFGETKYESKKKIRIPCKLGKTLFSIETYVINGNIPWLVGKETLEKMGAVIDLENMEIWLRDMNQRTKVRCDQGGHLRVQLWRNEKRDWWSREWLEGGERGVIEKLHKQFGHPGKDRLID